jgi:tRNA-dihydrouridine synthase A
MSAVPDPVYRLVPGPWARQVLEGSLLKVGPIKGDKLKPVNAPAHRFCVAPMMDWTDRHCRVFHRRLTRRALLYTEMVTAPAVIHGDRARLLGRDDSEHPVALQLGGADPQALAEAAAIGEGFGYDEINLNVGCPSDRVQDGRFGACLMADPKLVAACVAAMQARVSVPVTVKCRIGIDDQDSEADLARFVETVADVGCRTFIVHARKAWLQGLSPKQNREVPPLDYQRVYRLKAARPDLTIVINGGIDDLDAAEGHLEHVDGVMLGRAAYQTPYILAEVDRRFFGAGTDAPSRAEAVEALIPYVEAHLRGGGRLNNIVRHMLGLYHGRPRGRLFRRYLSENAVKEGAGAEVLRAALALVEGCEETIAAAE